MNRKFTNVYLTLLVTVLLSGISSKAPAQTITHIPLFTFQEANGALGNSVSDAGDVNGDGVTDFIIGDNNNNSFASGRVRVLSGNDGSVLHTLNPNQGSRRFGDSVSGAGDVNGDGRADLIIGTDSDGINGLSGGMACVLSGSDGSILYTFHGVHGNDEFGRSVSGAGDVNGDGTPDMIVGAPTDCNSDDTYMLGLSTGRVRVLSGSDGSILYNFYGDSSGDDFGISVSDAGDVNGDGTPDIIVGAPRDDNNGNRSGSARVLSGSDGSVLYTFNGDSADDEFGRSVSGAGDVNGDGLADLIVGASLDDNNGSNSGSARVLSGSDGSILYSFDGGGPNDFFGHSVSGAGDVNGDGRADLIVGAFATGNGNGSVRVLSGSDGSVLYDIVGDSSGNNFGVSVSGAGDINGDGIDDFIVVAARGGTRGGGYVRVFVSQISSTLLGDVNQDGVVNFLDISSFISILAAGDFLPEADTNEDGIVNFLDIGPFIALLSI